MCSEKVTFKGHNGENLAAALDLPTGPHHGTALFAHCFTCTKDIPAARRIAQHLSQQGIAVLRFDFTGLGHSQGEFENTTFSSNIHDLKQAGLYLQSRNMAPDILIGHSLGGAAVLAAAGHMPTIKAVVTIGAPFDPEHVTHNFSGALSDIAQKGQAEVELAGRRFTIKQDFVEDVSAAHLEPAIRTLKKALLIMHAPKDTTVGIENAAAIFAAAKHPKSFVTLDDANHLVTRKTDAEYAAHVITAWVQRYLDETPSQMPRPPHGTVRISEADAAGFLQNITHGATHHVVADEPPQMGGTDRGMSPFGYLSAALGACTSMTIRMYARHKKLLLDHVYVDVTHEKRPVSAENTDATPQDLFTRHIHIKGNLSNSEREKLLEIANKCPVHRTLERSSDIKTIEV